MSNKVSIKNNISKDVFEEKQFDYIVITDLFGINESYDIQTSYFSSKGNGIIYKSGKPSYKTEVEINASIDEILNEVIYMLDDKKYVLDGSLITGSSLIKNKGFIRR